MWQGTNTFLYHNDEDRTYIINYGEGKWNGSIKQGHTVTPILSDPDFGVVHKALHLCYTNIQSGVNHAPPEGWHPIDPNLYVHVDGEYIYIIKRCDEGWEGCIKRGHKSNTPFTHAQFDVVSKHLFSKLSPHD